MAEIKEYYGYRYNKEKCTELNKVMAVPYDVMNDEQRNEFYKNSEYNVARISSGKVEDGDSEENNRYKRAGNFFEQWIKDGIVEKEKKPAMYLYEQHSIYKNTVFINHERLNDFLSGYLPRSEKCVSVIVLSIIKQQINDDFGLSNLFQFFVGVYEFLNFCIIARIIGLVPICNAAIQANLDCVK